MLKFLAILACYLPALSEIGVMMAPRAWEEIITDRIKEFLVDESGATAIEYALLCSLVACAIVIAVTSLGMKLLRLRKGKA